MRRSIRIHSAILKSRVELAALKGDKTTAELSEQFDVRAYQIPNGRTNCSNSRGFFLTKAERKAPSSGPGAKDLQAKIGHLTMATDFVERALGRIHGSSAKR